MSQQKTKKHYSHKDGSATGAAFGQGFPMMASPMGAGMPTLMPQTTGPGRYDDYGE